MGLSVRTEDAVCEAGGKKTTESLRCCISSRGCRQGEGDETSVRQLQRREGKQDTMEEQKYPRRLLTPKWPQGLGGKKRKGKGTRLQGGPG